MTTRSITAPRPGTPHASYAILDRRGSDWAVSFRRIPYDTTRAAARAQARPDWVAALSTGRL